ESPFGRTIDSPPLCRAGRRVDRAILDSVDRIQPLGDFRVAMFRDEFGERGGDQTTSCHPQSLRQRVGSIKKVIGQRDRRFHTRSIPGYSSVASFERLATGRWYIPPCPTPSISSRYSRIATTQN